MAAEFVALADLLRPSAVADDEPGAQPDAFDVERREPHAGSGGAPAQLALDSAVHDALRDARLFRARLADAFDDAASRLLRELASDVLARELRLAPCDLAAIVQRAGERAPVVRVRVAACDVARTAGALRTRGCDVAVVEDSALAGGDAVVEVAGGALDARLGVRLAVVLEAFA